MWSMLRHMVFIPPMCLSQIQKKSYYYVESLAPVVSHHLKVNVLFVVFF